MKTYIGAKIIQAEPGKKPGEDIDGYRVVYPDGYESWSPKEVFEGAYREADGLPFGMAIEAMKLGMSITRDEWPAAISLSIGPSKDDGETYIIWQDGTPAVLGHADLMADDWQILFAGE